MMAEVVEVNNLEHLQQYRMVWNALLPQTARASFFHTFDWLESYWQHFGSGRKLRVLVVEALGKPLGIVPLCVERRQHRFGKVRVLTFPLSDWGMWYGPIGRDHSALLFMAMQHIRNTRRDWDMVDLKWLASDDGVAAAASRALQTAGCTAQRLPYQQSSLVKVDGSWDDYLANQNSKWRNEYRRQLRKTEKLGRVEFTRYRPAGAAVGDGDPRWDLFDTCTELAAKSWQGQSATGNTLSHAAVQNFLRDSHAAAARRGMVDISLLNIDGQAAAFSYNYVFDGRVFGLRMGYDPEISPRGLGKTLLGHTLEDSFARGDAAVDLGIGEYDFKRYFRTTVEHSYRVTHYPLRALRSQGVRLTEWMKDRLGTQSKPAASKPNTA